METSLKKGDRVTLTEPIGYLKTSDIGLIVEVYGENENLFEEVNGSKDLEANRGLFDYAVAFPALRRFVDPESSAWLTNEIDLSQFHAGDVIPVRHDELVLVDSELRESA